MEIIAVPAIVSLVFSILTVYKTIITKVIDNEKLQLSKEQKAKLKENLIRIIPILGGSIGLIAGIVCYFAFPQILPTHDFLTDCLIGCVSGLSATGCNQIFKQLSKFGIVVKEEEKDGDKGDSSDEN